MKINLNQLCFLILLGSAIGLTIFLFAISLLTEYVVLQYASITTVFLLSMYAVKVVHRNRLILKKENKIV